MSVCKVSFREFISLPAGTVYSYCPPTGYPGFWRKGASITQSFAPDGCEAGDYFRQPLRVEYATGTGWQGIAGDRERWGEMDWDQEYLVYENDFFKRLW